MKPVQKNPTNDMIREEDFRLRKLRRTIDMVQCVIRQNTVSYEEAVDLVGFAKTEALKMFPDKEGVFDLVVMPRLKRTLVEKFNVGF